MAFPWATKLLLALAVLACLAVARPAQAQRALAGDPVGVCVARSVPAITPRALFSGKVPVDCSGAQYRHGPGDYWVLSRPLPAHSADTALRVRTTSVWQQRTTLYALYADGAVVIQRADGHALARHIQLGAIVEFALPARAAPLTRLAWHIDGAANARGIMLGVRIATAEESAHASVTMAAVYAGFVGLAIALLVYNLALWGALRHRFQLAYCLMVSAMLGYAISSSGALVWLWPQIANNDRLRVNFVLLGFVAAAAIWFARAFFEPRVLAGWPRRYCTAAIWLLASAGPIFATIVPYDVRFADKLYSWSFVVGLSAAGPVLWRAWARRSDYLWLFAIAWAAPLSFAIVRILAGLNVVPGGFWLDNSTVLSLALESLLSSLAIAYRVQTLSRERDAAVAGETVARRLADTDALTGLLNRRAFLAQAIGRPGPQTLHVIDIDHFKSVNETLGHDGGDEVLRMFARALRALTPAGALVARIGGEEFSIVTDAHAPIDPDRILARLRAARMPFDLTVTSSVGSCTGPLASEVDWKRLYHSADRALFDAKAAGRDRARRAMPIPLAA